MTWTGGHFIVAVLLRTQDAGGKFFINLSRSVYRYCFRWMGKFVGRPEKRRKSLRPQKPFPCCAGEITSRLKTQIKPFLLVLRDFSLSDPGRVGKEGSFNEDDDG